MLASFANRKRSSVAGNQMQMKVKHCLSGTAAMIDCQIIAAGVKLLVQPCFGFRADPMQGKTFIRLQIKVAFHMPF